MLMKPGPADSTFSYIFKRVSCCSNIAASSFGFFLRMLAAIMQAFVVICPLDKSSVTLDEYFFLIDSVCSLLIFGISDRKLSISKLILSIITLLFLHNSHF